MWLLGTFGCMWLLQILIVAAALGLCFLRRLRRELAGTPELDAPLLLGDETSAKEMRRGSAPHNTP